MPPTPPAPSPPPAAGSTGGAGGAKQTKSTGARAGQRAAQLGRDAGKAPIFRDTQKAAISGGSIVVGLIAYAIGINYLQHGWPGVTAWLKAKLFNQTSQDGNGIGQLAGGIPTMYFHTGAGAGPRSEGLPQTVTAAAPTSPAAPTPSGGTLYA